MASQLTSQEKVLWWTSFKDYAVPFSSEIILFLLVIQLSGGETLSFTQSYRQLVLRNKSAKFTK